MIVTITLIVVIMNLHHFLKSEHNVRKLFGKKEIEIIGKQLEGSTLTQSEKNRLSRDIRPKLECIQSMAQFQDEFKLKKDQDNRRLIAVAVNTIVQDRLQENIRAILLFGSFANKSSTKHSDMDICVLFKQPLSLKEATAFRIRISGQLSEKIDVQVFNILPQKIKREIAKNHKVLYQSRQHNDLDFTVQYMKDDAYFIRMHKIFGAAA
ncbi:MAG TPA: nucleotidyltransferase domain-containing protein [Candidatus Nanoarchaeia archaeon]|nr:nucleotidyltransferase domain-containing protein [Candidatus Nanoarchaeia archaeon]